MELRGGAFTLMRAPKEGTTAIVTVQGARVVAEEAGRQGMARSASFAEKYVVFHLAESALV